MLDPKNNLAPPSAFFTEQLSAFEVWLDFGGKKDESPMHLPILLQVLLSQTHRLRALLLLKKYLDLGAEAVNLSLLVGICPYISKLLQRPSADIRQVLVSIWSHVIGFDPQVRVDLIRDKGHVNFIQFLVSKDMPIAQRCRSAFVLSELCADYPEGQQACYQQGLYRACLSVLSPPQSMVATAPFKRAVCLCIFKLLEGFTLAKYQCLTEAVEIGYMQLYPLLTDGDYVVRAVAVLTLGELFGASNYSPSVSSPLSSAPTDPSKPSYPNYAINMQSSIGASSSRDLDVRRRNLEVRQHELQLALQVLETCADGSALVRKEAVIALAKFLELPSHIECILVVSRGLISLQTSSSVGDRYEFKSPWVVSTVASQTLVTQVQLHLEQTLDEIPKSRDSTSGDVPSVEAIMATAYVRIWLALREVRFKDPHKSVAYAAGCIVSRVEDLALATVNFTSQGQLLDLSSQAGPAPIGDNYASVPLHPRLSSSTDSAREVGTSSRGLNAFASKNDLRLDIPASRESSIKSLGMFTNDLDTPAPPLISHLYSWCRRLFLVPELGYSSIEDPLSQDGKDALFRGQLMMDVLNEAKQAVSFFSVPFETKEVEDTSKQESIYSSRPKSPFELSRPKSPLDFPVAQGRSLDIAADGEGSASNGNEKKFRVEQRAALNIDTSNLVSVVVFHAHLDLLAVADGNKIGVWSLQDFSLVSSIDQSMPALPSLKASSSRSSRITSLNWVNQSSDSLLMAGSDDGALRIWRDSGDVTPTFSGTWENSVDHLSPTLAATFHALPDIADTSSGSGMIISWQQSTGSLVSAGNSSTIRLWDMAREQCVRVFQTGLDTCTTSLCAQTVSGSQSSAFLSIPSSSYNVDFDPPPWAWIVAGFADGTISVYDERVAYYGGKVHNVKEHRSWVVSTHMRLDIPEVISASVSGAIKFMDVRTMRTYKTIEVHKSPLTACSVHNFCPIIATGSHAQFIKLLSLAGEQLGMIR